MGPYDLTLHHILSNADALRGFIKTLFEMEYVSTEKLDGKLTIPDVRVTDLLVRTVDKRGRNAIVHLELQSNNIKDMPEREGGYYGSIKSNFPSLVVYQIVIYVGFEPLTMLDYLEEGVFTFRYVLKDIRQIPAESFIQGGSSMLAMLGILCKPAEHLTKEEFVTSVVKAVVENEPDPKEQKINLSLLSTLVILRNLTTHFLEVMQKLKYEFDESVYLNDDYFRKIAEQKKAEGKKEGLIEGKKEGLIEGKKEITHNIVLRLRKEFNYSVELIASLLALPQKEVSDILRAHGYIEQ